MSTASIPATSTAAPRRQASGRADLTVEQRGDLSWSEADAAALDRMIQARPHVGVFLTRAWLSGLFAEPSLDCEPVLLLLREAGTLRGIVPLSVRHGLTMTRVSLLGGGLGSDRVDLLSERGYEGACADRVLDWLQQECPRGYVLSLRDVPGDSSLWGAIGRATSGAHPRLVHAPREVYALPYLPLHEASGAAEPATLPGWSDDHTIARHRRWLERKCHLRIETLTEVDDVRQGFAMLRAFLRSRWGAERSVLENPRVQRFHLSVLPLLLREGRLRMIRLSGDMRPIAIFYGLAIGSVDARRSCSRWWGYYLAGYDRAWAGRIHLGRIALATAIDLALKEGASEFDFLKGPERVKYLWPVRERITVDADVYSRTLAPRMTWMTRAARNAAAALIRSV